MFEISFSHVLKSDTSDCNGYFFNIKKNGNIHNHMTVYKDLSGLKFSTSFLDALDMIELGAAIAREWPVMIEHCTKKQK